MVLWSDVVDKINGIIGSLSVPLNSEEIENGWNEENRLFFLTFFKELKSDVEAGKSVEHVGSIGRGMDFRGIINGCLLDQACGISLDLQKMEEVILDRIKDTSEAPRGPDIFYKCLKCGEFIPSQPKDNVDCKCGNIIFDVDYHRLAIRDYSKMQVVRKLF